MANVLIDTQITNALGLATFAALAPGNYYYVMTIAPTGYTLDPTQYPVTITSATPVTETRNSTPTQTGTLKVIKHVLGNEAMLLPGATFQLIHGLTPIVPVSAATDVNGEVSFPNLMTRSAPNEETYTVNEVTPPVGYVLNPTVYTEVITPSATTEQKVPDTGLITGSAVVELQDTNYNLQKLPGAEYELYWTTTP